MALQRISATDVDFLTSNGAIQIPIGTTAQRPSNPTIGLTRYNTDTSAMENYTANGWFKVSVQVPTIASISGTIYSGNTSILTLSGSGFTSSAYVNYASGTTTANVAVIPSPGGSSISIETPSTIYNLNAGNTVSISVTNSDGITSGSLSTTIIGLPTGGTIVQSGNTRRHTFTSSGTLTVPTGFSASASYLVVAGGGGGGAGNSGGGGGAGGLLTGSTTLVSNSPVSITVGAAGTGSSGSYATSGTNSSLGPISATGGGSGGSNLYGKSGAPGGSGGGSGTDGSSPGTAGSGTPGQGNPGGIGSTPGPYYAGGGGGGAGGAGSNAPNTSTAGAGGVGLSSSITGTPVYYGGGGGGSVQSVTTSGAGGTGGGGAGGNSSNVNGTSGTTNTGGGGGAGGYGAPSVGNGGAGGSGIVIVSYTLP